MFKTRLLASVASLAITSSSTIVFAQTPDNQQLYKMILELKAENAKSKADADATRSQLAITRRRLDTTERALLRAGGVVPTSSSGPVRSAPVAPPYAPPPPPPAVIAARLPEGPAPVFGAGPYPWFGGPVDIGGPAVSRPNFKFEAAGGSAGGTALGYQAGALTLPIGDKFGFQADGIVSEQGAGTYYGTAGHLFWRDPSRASVGVYGSVGHFTAALSTASTQTQFTFASTAATAELYLGRFSSKVSSAGKPAVCATIPSCPMARPAIATASSIRSTSPTTRPTIGASALVNAIRSA